MNDKSKVRIRIVDKWDGEETKHADGSTEAVVFLCLFLSAFFAFIIYAVSLP